MSLNVDNIRAALTGGGARPSLFKVSIASVNILNGTVARNFEYMAKSAQIPPSTIGVIEVPYMGRKIKVAGDRIFPEWTVTIINDENFSIRSALENWMNLINEHVGNVRNGSVNSNPNSYKTTASVIQYGKDGSILREYTFYGLWPSETSAIELGWETVDTIEEFPITFQYDYWTVGGLSGVNSVNGSVGGSVSVGGVNINASFNF